MSSIYRLDPNFVQAFDGYKIAQDLIRKLITQKPVLRAILFGSAAEHRNTSNSDLDIRH
ncbi:MAG: nucleotidyltransferase domain-containing protein [Bdellovibrionales bacterium]|nr:nucleotidyltransferase domain-containing protein [Bdellovibrionales bacterium]